MGKHSRTERLASSNPLSDQGTSALRGTAARVRMDALETHFSGQPGTVDFHSSDAHTNLRLDPSSRLAMSDRGQVMRTIAHSSLPLQHLNGIQFMNVQHGGGMAGGALGLYYPDHRGMVMDGDVDTRNPDTRLQRERAVVHEIGHHVETTSRGTMGMGGKSEAVAENYADRYSARTPVTHMGHTEWVRPSSNYDTHVPGEISDVWKRPWDQSGAGERSIYAKTRAKGTMPDQY